MVRAYIGTYTKEDSEGIYLVELSEEGKVLEVRNVAKVDNPTYLALSNDNKYLYSVSRVDGKGAVTSFEVEADGRLKELTSVAQEGNPPCYVELNSAKNTLLSANYHLGTIDSYSVENGRLVKLLSTDHHEGKGVHERQEKPHVHFSGYTPSEDYVFSCDLGTDEITTYKLNEGILEKVAVTKVKDGSGVRHIVFSSDEKQAFVMTELTSEIIAFDYDGKGNLTNPKYYPTLPEDFTSENKGSAIKISNDNKFIYVSNRGQDAIVVFENAIDGLKQVQTISTVGKGPRDFDLSKDTKFAIATNENSGTITVYRIDKTTGQLTVVDSEITIPEAVCAKFI